MTMQIRSGLLIAGFDAKALRDFLRKCHTGFYQDRMIRDLKVSAWKAARIIGALLREQYIEPEVRWRKTVRAMQWYRAARKGKELMRASAARPVTRKTAQMSLDAFMRRVNEVNRDPRYLCFITKVVVFGSFLKNVDRLGDVDVAVDMDYLQEQLSSSGHTAHSENLYLPEPCYTVVALDPRLKDSSDRDLVRKSPSLYLRLSTAKIENVSA